MCRIIDSTCTGPIDVERKLEDIDRGAVDASAVSLRVLAPMSEYPVEVPIEVRFRDTDAMGHVNNAVYLTYFEVGRMAYWDRMSVGESYDAVPFVLARAEVDFKAPAHVGDILILGIRVSRISNRSFDFEYHLVRDADELLIATGSTVQVTYDYDDGKTIQVPDNLKQRIAALEDGSVG